MISKVVKKEMRKMKTEETKICEKQVEMYKNVININSLSAKVVMDNRIHIIERDNYVTKDGEYISSKLNQIIIDKQALLKIVAMTKPTQTEFFLARANMTKVGE